MSNDFFPWDEIPDSNVFPDMTGRFEYTKLEDGASAAGKRMFKAQFTCVEPAQFAGMSHFENFVTGNEENMGAIVPGSMGTRQLKASLAASQLPKNNNIQQICDLVTASKPQLMISISYYKEAAGEYKGQERNRITAYHKIGERQVEIAPKVGAGVQHAATQAVAPPAAGQQAAAPVAAPVAQPAAAPTAQPVASPAPQPEAPPVQQAPPVQAPPAQAAPAPQAAAAPAQPAAPAAPAAAPPPNSGYSGQMLKCQIAGCGQEVPVEEFSKHVESHQQAG